MQRRRKKNDLPRNQQFGDHKPFADDALFRLEGTAGSLYFFNCTAAQFELAASSEPSLSYSEHTSGHAALPTQSQCSEASFLWRSRDNRKGRHAVLLRRRPDDIMNKVWVMEATNSPAAIVRGLRAMATLFPYWDISWLLATMFTLGSLLWIANGFIVLLPFVDSGVTEELHYASAWSAFAAGSIYLFASVLLMLEAINAYKSGCFGWTIESDAGASIWQLRARPGQCRHRHRQRPEGQSFGGESVQNRDALDKRNDDTHWHHWEWWPSWSDLRSHYFHELGFVACGIQLVSVFIFWLTKFVALPEVSRHLSIIAMDGVYWAPQMLACLGFVVSSSLVMLETQSRWYMPAVAVMGWHVGLWKLIGSIGFTVCAVLGPLSQHEYPHARYQSNLASFWGSWALLVGSMVQWYESLDKNPVVEEGMHNWSEYNDRWFKDTGIAETYNGGDVS